jgi:uncharacterized membrane protein YccC
VLRRRPQLTDRAGPLLEEAAERSRVSWRARVERLRLAWRSIVQASLSAGVAWFIAKELLGHQQAFFAPVSAIIVLGLTVSAERGRRAAEVAIGVAVGIAVADLIVLAVGTGGWQVTVVVGLTVAAAIFLGSGSLMATQAAVSAVLVATIQPPTSGVNFNRFFDALVGGATALIVNGVVLPVHPARLVRRASRPVIEELAETLEDIAEAIVERDREAAEAALERARGIDDLGALFDEAVEIGRETTRFVPPRRGERVLVESYADASGRLDLAVRNVRVLARGVIRAMRLDDNVPPEVAGALRDLATAVRALGPALDDASRVEEVRTPALRAAADASVVLERTGNLSVSVIIGQVRSAAVDLLMSTGMGYDEAAGAVTRAAREAEERL